MLTGSGLRKLAGSLSVVLTASEVGEKATSSQPVVNDSWSTASPERASPPKSYSPHRFFTPEPPTCKRQTLSGSTCSATTTGKTDASPSSPPALFPQRPLCDLERSPPHLRESSPSSCRPSPLLNASFLVMIVVLSRLS